MTQTEIIHVEPQLTAIVRKSVAMTDLRTAQQSARKALDSALTAADVRPLGRTLTIWRMPQNGIIDYAPGVLVPQAFEARDEVSLFTLPEGRAAHFRLVGAYDGLPAAWGHLFKDCEAQDVKLAGLNWEIYPAPDDPADSMVTDLYALLI